MDAEVLIGMKEIQMVYNRSSVTIQKVVNENGFPAQKIGGEYHATRSGILKWMRMNTENAMPVLGYKHLELAVKLANDKGISLSELIERLIDERMGLEKKRRK